jgi:hypothetical protein
MLLHQHYRVQGVNRSLDLTVDRHVINVINTTCGEIWVIMIRRDISSYHEVVLDVEPGKGLNEMSSIS